MTMCEGVDGPCTRAALNAAKLEPARGRGGRSELSHLRASFVQPPNRTAVVGRAGRGLDETRFGKAPQRGGRVTARTRCPRARGAGGWRNGAAKQSGSRYARDSLSAERPQGPGSLRVSPQGSA